MARLQPEPADRDPSLFYSVARVRAAPVTENKTSRQDLALCFKECGRSKSRKRGNRVLERRTFCDHRGKMVGAE